MKLSKKSILLLIFLTTPIMMFSHPHMFISTEEEFVFEDNKLTGCWMEWTFDSFFSSDIILGYDYDHNGVFNSKETQDVYDNAFQNLKNYYYFTFIRQGSKRSNPKKIYNFSVYKKNDLIAYKFYIDLSKYDGNEIYLSVYDYTFFCNIDMPKDSIKFTYINSDMDAKFTLERNEDYPVYYDPFGAANDNTVYYKWRKGLQTFYPMEIHIKY